MTEIRGITWEEALEYMAERFGCTVDEVKEYDEMVADGMEKRQAWVLWCEKYGKDPDKNYFAR